MPSFAPAPIFTTGSWQAVQTGGGLDASSTRDTFATAVTTDGPPHADNEGRPADHVGYNGFVASAELDADQTFYVKAREGIAISLNTRTSIDVSLNTQA